MKIFKQKFILDESGSMSGQRATVISGFNEQLDTMRQEEIRDGISYLVSLTKFSDNVTIVYKDLPLNKVQPLSEETYSPGGWTALYDAIGATIDSAKLGETDTFVTIFTDGQENKSKKWKKASIKTLIDIRQNENKWGFVFFGANQDAWQEASSISIANALNYTAANTGSAISATSMCRSAYVTTATSGVYNVSNLTCNVNQDDLVK
jgi:von Willebrand factor type A domain